MNREEHIERHKLLHRMFDELIADFVGHTNKLLSTTTIMELMEWSYQQTKDPAEVGDRFFEVKS